MKPTKIHNENGEIIEIKCDGDGGIKIRHSGIDSENFGDLHEWSKRLKQPGLLAALKNDGIDPENPGAKKAIETLGKVGGYIVIRGNMQTREITAKEIAMIYNAIKSSGGIVPNWANRP